MDSNFVIAIDGPSASGKGTVASLVAKKLDWQYLDSGALYRVSALYAKQSNISWSEEKKLVELINQIPVHFLEKRIFLNEIDVTDLIREEEIGMGASEVAKLPQVREALFFRQRAFLEQGNLVADGRDMGSVVFPEAKLKVFLTATVEERAKRRAKQLNILQKSEQFKQIYLDIENRDYQDTHRKIAPLIQIPEAHYLDTSNLSIELSVKKILEWYQQIIS